MMPILSLESVLELSCGPYHWITTIHTKKKADLRYILILKCQNSETLKLAHLNPFFEIIQYFDKICLTDVIFTY
jgi:hypothetical protein